MQQRVWFTWQSAQGFSLLNVKQYNHQASFLVKLQSIDIFVNLIISLCNITCVLAKLDPTPSQLTKNGSF